MLTAGIDLALQPERTAAWRDPTAWLGCPTVRIPWVDSGGMPERLIGAVLKTARAAKPSGVRIPLPPPNSSVLQGIWPSPRSPAVVGERARTG